MLRPRYANRKLVLFAVGVSGLVGNAYTFPASKPLQVKHHAWNGMREQIDETGCAQPHENANGQAADRSAYKTANVNGK